MKKNPFFCNQTNSKKPVYKTQHCTNVPLSIKKLRSFIAQTENHKLLSSETPQSPLFSKLHWCFPFMEIWSKNSEDSCSVANKKKHYAHGYNCSWKYRIYRNSKNYCETISLQNDWYKYTDSFGGSYLPPWNTWNK